MLEEKLRKALESSGFFVVFVAIDLREDGFAPVFGVIGNPPDLDHMLNRISKQLSDICESLGRIVSGTKVSSDEFGLYEEENLFVKFNLVPLEGQSDSLIAIRIQEILSVLKDADL